MSSGSKLDPVDTTGERTHLAAEAALLQRRLAALPAAAQLTREGLEARLHDVTAALAEQNGGLPEQNGGLPEENGGLPGQNGGPPGQNGGLPGQNGGLPGTAAATAPPEPPCARIECTKAPSDERSTRVNRIELDVNTDATGSIRIRLPAHALRPVHLVVEWEPPRATAGALANPTSGLEREERDELP